MNFNESTRYAVVIVASNLKPPDVEVKFSIDVEGFIQDVPECGFQIESYSCDEVDLTQDEEMIARINTAIIKKCLIQIPIILSNDNKFIHSAVTLRCFNHSNI